jgi:surface protein
VSGIARKLMGVTKGDDVDPDLVLVVDTTLGSKSIQLFDVVVGSSFVVNWGDNTTDSYTSLGVLTHTYAADGVYTVRISGLVTEIEAFEGSPELTGCLSFGKLGIQRLFGVFRNCVNFVVAPDVLPNTVTDIVGIFRGATSFNYNISGWNVSNILSFELLFEGATSFNQPIGSWDTSSVTNMNSMFSGATSFNQDIGGWDTSSVFGMAFMFNNATAFNQDLTGWCVGNIGALPSNFATGATNFSSSDYPVWGTCPGFEVDGNITYIGAAAGTTSATLPAHQAGDLILAFAFRSGSTVATTLPAGWTSIALAGANVTHGRLAFKIAQSSSETSGTWTNATRVIFQVYRNAEPANITAAVLRSTATGSSTTVSYNAVNTWKDLAWTVAFMGHRSTNNSAGTPTGLTARSSTNSSARMLGADSTNTSDVWATRTVNIGGTSSGWRTFVLRLRNKIKKIGS